MRSAGAVLSLFFLGQAVVAAPHLAKRGEKPAATVDPGTASDCTLWEEKTDDSVTCKSLQDAWGISAEDFREWNPLVGDDCKGMKVGNSYCVEVNYGLPREPTTSTSSKPSSTIAPGNGVVTPTPTQPSMVGNCNKFYKVQKGDSCDEIAGNHGISGADFAKWNPKVGAQCSGLWADTYACVGVLNGGDPTVTDKPSTTTPAGNGIATPSPTQPNMVDNCNKFHFVNKGDSCADVLSSNGISIDDFAKWNPKVGSQCTGLWADTYACVGVTGGQTGGQTGKPTTSAPNAIQTPSPIQPDMIQSCRKFHFVESGQSCQDIASRYGVTVSDLTSWNPKAGSDCSRIYGQTWACVDPIRSFNFDDGSSQQWKTASGSFDASSKILAAKSLYNKAYYNVVFNDAAFEAQLKLPSGRGGNAGLIFRASNIGSGTDGYQGYYAGISASGDLLLGRVNNDWRELGRAKVRDVAADRTFAIKVVAKGDYLSVYVNDMDRPALSVRDGIYKSGRFGVRTHETEAAFDNFAVSTVVFDDFERNLVNWKIYDGGFDARTKEMVAASVQSGKIAYQAEFEDVVVEADVAITANGNGGFIIRASNIGNGPDAYRGYYIGLESSSNVVLGRADGGWRQLASGKFDIRTDVKYHLRVKAQGDYIQVWVDENLVIQHRDGSYSKGMTGVRVYSTGAVVDNFTVQKL